MFVPFAKPFIQKQDIKHLNDAIKSGWISKGKYVDNFEKEIKNFFKTKYACTVSSGSSAIFLSYLVLGLKPGDEIVVPGYGFLAAANVAKTLGLKVVFADVDPKTFCVSYETLKKAISKKTKLAVVIHLYGNVCEVDKILSLCKRKKIFLLEDSAQAFGSKFKGKYAGTYGDMGVFSFTATKTVTTGEGGVVIFKNNSFYEKFLLYRSYGYIKKNYYPIVHGHNLRMSNLLASLGFSQMKRINSILRNRKKIHSIYKKKLKKNFYSLQTFDRNSSPVPWAISIKLNKNFSQKKRDLIIKKLEKKKIQTRSGYYSPDELSIFGKIKKIPNSSYLSKRIITLPYFEGLKEKEINYICKIFDSIKL